MYVSSLFSGYISKWTILKTVFFSNCSWKGLLFTSSTFKVLPVLQNWPTQMDANSFKNSYPGNLANQFFAQPHVCSPRTWSWSFIVSFPSITKYFKLEYFMVTVAKMDTNCHFMHEALSVYKHRSRRAPFLVSCLSICIRMYPSRCVRNLLDLLVSVTWYS